MAPPACGVYTVDMPPSAADVALVRRARITLLLSVVVTIALYAVPYGWYAAYPLMLISTVVHEMGHGIAALMASPNRPNYVFLDYETPPSAGVTNVAKAQQQAQLIHAASPTTFVCSKSGWSA